MTVEVSGTLFDEGGNALTNTTCFVVAVDDLIGQSGGARAKRGVTATTDGSGVLTVDLEPGKYILYVNPTANDSTTQTVRRQGTLLVLVGETSMTLEEALDANVQVTPSVLIAAEQAAQEAADSATAAAASANAAADSETAAELASASALANAVASGANIYPTISDGIAAVSVGDVFMVPITPSGGLDVREKTGASTSTSIGEILSPTQFPTDATAGRVLKVGDFGLGQTSDPPTIDDWDRLDWPSGIYKVGASPDGDHPGGAGTAIISRWNNEQQTQLYIQHFPGSGRGQTWTRAYQNDEWATWRKSYDSGNAVGTIAGGALIESGSTANGSYRWTDDGTLECWATVTLTQTNGNRLDFDWSFPVEFDSGESPNIQATINENATSVTPTPDELSVLATPPGVSPNVTTGIRVRRTGATLFDPADTAVVFVKAIGKKTP